MRSTHLFWGIVFLLVFAITLSNCDAIDNLPNSLMATSTGTVSAQTTPSPTAPAAIIKTESPTLTPESSQIITIWLPPDLDPNKDSPTGKLMATRLAAFETKNEGVKVHVRIKNLSGPQGMLETLSITHLAAPLAVPSIITLPQTDLTSAATQELIYPLISTQNNIDQTDWYPYSRAMAKVDKKWYGAPFFGDALILVYRDYPLNSNFSTWDKIQKNNQPVLFPASDPGALTTLTLYQSLAGENSPGKDTQNLNENYLIQVFSFIQHAAHQGLFPFSLSQYDRFDQTWATFNNRQSRWVISWASTYLNSGSSDSQAVPFPGLKDAPFSLATGEMFALSDPSPEHQSLSMKLIDFLITPDFLTSLGQTIGSIPTRVSANNYPNDLKKQMFFDQVSLSAHLQPALSDYLTLASRLKDTTNQVIRFQLTPQEAAKQVINGSPSRP